MPTLNVLTAVAVALTSVVNPLSCQASGLFSLEWGVTGSVNPQFAVVDPASVSIDATPLPSGKIHFLMSYVTNGVLQNGSISAILSIRQCTVPVRVFITDLQARIVTGGGNNFVPYIDIANSPSDNFGLITPVHVTKLTTPYLPVDQQVYIPDNDFYGSQITLYQQSSISGVTTVTCEFDVEIRENE